MNTPSPTVIVTGASRGLGAATACQLGRMGAHVIIIARSEDDLAKVAAEIEEAGGRATAVPGDVTDESAARRAIAAASESDGSLVALINNAGVLAPIAPIAEADPAMWQQNLLVNLYGPFLFTHLALSHLREGNGRVIHVSSGAAVKVVQGWSAYCAAQAAVNHFNRVLAEEEPAITALAFRPGVVDTEMQARIRQEGIEGMPEEVHGRYINLHQSGELLPPEVPGKALARLALHAPAAWSGEFIQWDDARIQELPG